MTLWCRNTLRNRSAAFWPGELTLRGLPLDGWENRHGPGRLIVGVELRLEEMARYLEIKAIRLMRIDAPTE